MSLVIGKEEKKDYGRIGEGTYGARLVQVIDLGKQESDFYKNKDGSPVVQHKVWLTWELPSELIEVGDEEKPRWISKEYTVSFNEKATLPKIINAMGGDKGTLDEYLGAACMVQIGSSKNDKDKVVNVTSPVKGFTVGDLVNSTTVFDFDSPDQEVFDSLPDFLQEKITSAQDWEGFEVKKEEPKDDDFEDDIPF